MIARLWHGITLTEKAAGYLALLQQRAMSDYRSTPGNLSVEILHRDAGAVTHFLIVTHWTSPAAIAAFAGQDVERARYYPEDSDYLLEFEPTVTHYVVAEAPASNA
jgi:heme-degrading monooxygenase HmoA